jgi:putative addiction module killer protein
MKYHIKIFLQENGKAPFSDWIKDLDGSIRARIGARIARFEDGHFGDHKSVGDGLLEARFFFGPGYRIYFSIQGDQIILLLTGGDKSTQSNDIEKAKQFLNFYLEDQHANKKP